MLLIQIRTTKGPKDPWAFAKDIEANQRSWRECKEEITILFNKGRYFECHELPQRTLDFLESNEIRVEYNCPCGSWDELKRFVSLMNSIGIYVKINVDWI